MSISRRTILASSVLPWLPAAQKLPVLVIDGINNHDWQAGTRAIRAILEASGRFRIDISTTPPREAPSAAWETWAPDFGRYRAVISNFNGGHLADGLRWPRRVENGLEAYIRRGGGFVSFHAANNAFLEWPAYNEIIGLGWRDPAFGPSLIVDEQERIVVVPAGKGLGPGHGPRHDFLMTVRDPRHPITVGLPKQWLHPSEQLTHGQHAPAHPEHGAIDREIRILTYAWSKDSHEREPMDWIRTWGRGRVYVTMLGHTWKNEPNPNLRDVGFQAMFARAVEWAAAGRVSLPLPAKLPGTGEPLLNDLV